MKYISRIMEKDILFLHYIFYKNVIFYNIRWPFICYNKKKFLDD